MVSYESIRRWVNHFGPMIAANLRKRRTGNPAPAFREVPARRFASRNCASRNKMRPAFAQSRLNSTVAAIGAHPLSEGDGSPPLTFMTQHFGFVTLRRQNGGSDFPGRIPTALVYFLAEPRRRHLRAARATTARR